MKKIKHVLGTVLLLGTLAAVPALAAKSSIDYGKQLFNDPKIGGSTTESSCNSCHDNGTKLEAAADNPKLVKAINQCITGPMQGEKLDGRSVEMRSLKMYIDTLKKN